MTRRKSTKMSKWTFTFLLAVIFQLGATQSVNFNDLLRGFASEAVGNCQFTTCENWPKCPQSWKEQYKTKEGCSGVKERKYCCSPELIPQTCYYSGCGRNAACPGSHREFFRDREGCSGFDERAYCCRNDVNIPCFDIPCYNSFRHKRECPAGYEERKRTKFGCSGSMEKFVCCLEGRDVGVAVGGMGNGQSEQNTFSETHTTQLEGGGIRTVTYSNYSRTSCSGWFCGGADILVKREGMWQSTLLGITVLLNALM